MVDQPDGSQPAGESSHEAQPKTGSASNTDAIERQKIVNLKVTHILLTVFFLWLTYVLDNVFLESN